MLRLARSGAGLGLFWDQAGWVSLAFSAALPPQSAQLDLATWLADRSIRQKAEALSHAESRVGACGRTQRASANAL